MKLRILGAAVYALISASTAVFAQTAQLNVANTWTATQTFGAGLKLPNNQSIVWADASGNLPTLILQNDNNFVFYGTNSSGSTYGVWSQQQHSTSAPFKFFVPVQLQASGSTGDASSMSVTPTGASTPQTLAALNQQMGLTPAMFGAKCDGSTDDSTALQAWLNSFGNNTIRRGSQGVCNFGVPLSMKSNLSFVTLTGNGMNLNYTGSNTTALLITIGNQNTTGGCSEKGWRVSDLRISSSTKMTFNYTVQFADFCESDFDNIVVDGDLQGNGNLWNGAYFYGGNSVKLRGENEFRGQNIGLSVSGDSNLQFTDFDFQSGKITHSAVGLDICGRVGGFVAGGGLLDVLENGDNIVISQDCINQPNLQIFFGSGLATDVTTGASGSSGNDIWIKDAGSVNSFMFLTGTWVTSSTNDGLHINPGTEWTVSISGGSYGNHGAAGIYNGSSSTQINVVGAAVWGNKNYGFNAGYSGNITSCGILYNTHYPANMPGNSVGGVNSSC